MSINDIPAENEPLITGSARGVAWERHNAALINLARATEEFRREIPGKTYGFVTSWLTVRGTEDGGFDLTSYTYDEEVGVTRLTREDAAALGAELLWMATRTQ